MEVTTDWGDEKHTIILSIFGHGWEPYDFTANEALIQQMMGTAECTVDVIHDLRRTHVPTKMVAYLSTLAMNSALTQPNAGLIVIVGADSFLYHLREIFTAMNRHLGRRVLLVSTMEDAYTLIRASRAKSTS